jgi:poly(A) polymerase
MQLCTADITSKNEMKVKRFLNNYELVKQKLIEVEEKDRIRNWQPPITGEIIMQTFNIKPSASIGTIKQVIRDAILDGHIKNNYDEAFELMLTTAASMGLKPVA